ncbi:MAG: hypothetical protein A3D92_12735 [Bacteroidetes bacterium RIFCSPHIGHO2_02_FULL_44_7]|nr:MAG: hypothetical protein A3D92_12735 [Bacteroidetes bacterium RIFCSPHIGHO2_02_FULL_44_7]
MKWGLVLCLFFGLVACSDLQRPEQLNKIAGLVEMLDGAESSLENISVDKLQGIFHASEAVKAKILAEMPDSLDLDRAIRLDRFREAGDAALLLSVEREELRKIIPDYRKALDKLKQDIENGNGQKHKYDEYIDFEEKKVKDFSARVDDCLAKFRAIVDVDDELREVIEGEFNERMRSLLVQLAEKDLE